MPRGIPPRGEEPGAGTYEKALQIDPKQAHAADALRSNAKEAAGVPRPFGKPALKVGGLAVAFAGILMGVQALGTFSTVFRA
jgi:hypothetical protein